MQFNDTSHPTGSHIAGSRRTRSDAPYQDFVEFVPTFPLQCVIDEILNDELI
jgi:hypothetical protein